MKMQGNTILVAGGASGIGRGLAELLHRLGNEVLIFDAEPGTARAVAAANPGMRVVDLDLASVWSVADFSEQVAALCPELNMLVDIAIAFPVRHLPGLQALLDDDPTPEKLEARRLGIQQLTGTLLPHFRKRAHGSVMKVSVGPVLAPAGTAMGGLSAWAGADGGLHASALSVRKRWASACIEVMDVARPSRAERMSPLAAARPGDVSRTQFVSSVAHLLAEGLQEMAALARLRALWPAPRPATHRTRDDDLLSEIH